MEAFEREVLERLTKIEVKIDSYKETRTVAFDNRGRLNLLEKHVEEKTKLFLDNSDQLDLLENKVTTLENNIVDIAEIVEKHENEKKEKKDDGKWTKREVISSIISTLVSAVIGALIIFLGLGG